MADRTSGFFNTSTKVRPRVGNSFEEVLRLPIWISRTVTGTAVTRLITVLAITGTMV